ncbi:MAG: SDR family oxidoreductase [Planctomycetaceae bacterium]|nr:SDR family oxidoreductase [Planctomycetaceae bacterium]
MTTPPLAAVTGASEGLGKEFARQLAAEGYNLIVIARRAAMLQELKADLESKFGIQVEPVVCDLSKPDELKLVEERLEKEESLEILVNNAGFGLGDAFPDVNTDLEESMIRLHAIALMRLSRAALIPMCKRNKGYIINVSSVAAFLHGHRTADYVATKAYALSFSKSLQCDVRRYGVRVQALCPGFTHTGFHSTESMKFFQKGDVPPWLWLSSEYVVRTSLHSIRRRSRVVCIPSLRYRIILALLCNPVGSALVEYISGPGRPEAK